MASLEQAFAHITKHGLAKTNRFNVLVALPEKLQRLLNGEKSEDDSGSLLQDLIGTEGVKLVKFALGSGVEITRGLDIMCDSIDIPGKSLTTSESKYNADFFAAPYGIVYPPMSTTFVVSRDFLERNIIDEWMNLIINPKSHNIAYYDDFISPTIEVQQLNELDNVTHKVKLINAYPTEITSMPLNNESRDEYHKMTVQWTYERWETSEVEDDGGVGSLAQTPLGPLVTPILSNPVVQKGVDFIENQTGIEDLEGVAVDYYNQIDDLVRNTTGQSVNKSASLLNGIKSNIDISGDISNENKSKLIEVVDGVLSKLNPGDDE